MMKIPRFFRHRKLWAATARRSSAASAGMDFEEMPEPNMKLSRALLIVLLLHVVAVSGIIAFNAIKTRESSFVPASSTSADPKPSHSPSQLSSKDDHANAPAIANRPSHKGTGGQEAKPVSSGKTHVVKKGDNPVTIAKKLKVPYDDLMALNHIEDPRKLRIGQKLLIPKITKPKKTDGKAVNAKEKKSDVRHAKQKARST